MATLSMAAPACALPLDAVAASWRGYARSLMDRLAGERPQTDRSDEVALVERARRGDLDAQRELVDRLLPQLRAVSNALLGRTADADDAVQIALMRVLENLASWRGDAALRHWARRVAANVCLRMSEQNRRHARAVGDETDLEELGASAPEESFPEMLPGTVHAYLERLPTVQREAVVLRHALGYSVEEIAELSGTAVGTVKSRLLCGRQALRKLIRRDDAVDELAAGLRRRAQR